MVLGTPPATHYPLAKAALEAGLDVVVDKPFAVRSAEGQELIELAARLGRVLTVFQNRRWDGDFLTVESCWPSGALGTVTRFESRFERWSPGGLQGLEGGAPRRTTAAGCCSTSAPTCWTRRCSSSARPR